MNSWDENPENLDHAHSKLIQKKPEMFPNIKKAIVDAMIEPISEKEYRINIGSADDTELAKMMFPQKLRL